MWNLLSEINNEVYNLLNEPTDSITYDRVNRVLPKINEVIKQVCRGSYADITQPIIYKWWDLLFLRKL